MSSLTVQAVCGFGVGSSTLLKIKIGSILNDLGIEAKVFTGDLSSLDTACDVIVTTKELAENVRERANVSVIVISNLMDSEEIKEKMEEFLKNR